MDRAGHEGLCRLWATKRPEMGPGGKPGSGTQSLALGTIEPGLSRPLVAT